MRNTIQILFLFSLLSVFGFQKPPAALIKGTWMVSKVEKGGVDDHVNPNKFIRFFGNGKLEGGKIGKKADKFGNWELNAAGDTLIMSQMKTATDNGSYHVVELSKKKMVLSYKNSTIYLSRGKGKKSKE